MKKLKDTLKEIRLQELERIKEELIPHFEKYGELYIEDSCIKINYGGMILNLFTNRTRVDILTVILNHITR